MSKVISLGKFNIDLSPIIEVTRSREFRRLHYAQQLGLSSLVFPLATHTRELHSFDTYYFARRRALKWVEQGRIDRSMLTAFCMAALLHDIGHGPYSHTLECLFRMNHKDWGERVIRGLRDPIQSCGVDFDLLFSMFIGGNRLSTALSHRCLGVDKIAYCWRDHELAGLGCGFDVDSVMSHVFFQDEKLVVDVVGLSSVADLYLAYSRMHKAVYFRKTPSILQRWLQQIFFWEQENSEDLRKPEIFYGMTEPQLNSRLIGSSDARVRTKYNSLEVGSWPKVAVSIHPEDCIQTEREKPMISRFSWPSSRISSLVSAVDPRRAHAIEQKISELTRIRAEDLLFVPPCDHTRFIPGDVEVVNNGKNVGTVYQASPGLAQQVNSIATRAAVVRVCTTEANRNQLNNKAPAVVEYLDGIAT